MSSRTGSAVNITPMTTTALYNSLSSIEAANAQLNDRDTLLSRLAPLLAQYGHQYGVCLVHAHCTLHDGERMIAKGNVSEPSRDADCYPERWLITGEPYEFTVEPTQSPPAELFDAIRAIVGDVGVLGLFYAGGLSDGVSLERTEGRRNITELVAGAVDVQAPENVETAWLPGQQGNPVKMVCKVFCPINPNSGHTKTRQHYDHQDQTVLLKLARG
ncbi:hypothetical protein OBBRIDRAFT_802739 [Obba rivulosa]|uniref:Uncharacterized protein n=1 Tax=Obba rivulosa TaxID=1052685 RepID=A0A8E2B243_9APHY|nr:hypothetical protein OBBRIDRAFT_802739 [Obba rivulosa]